MIFHAGPHVEAPHTGGYQMSFTQKVHFWITVAIFVICYAFIFRGVARFFLRNIRMIRTRLQHARETHSAAQDAIKKIKAKRTRGDT